MREYTIAINRLPGAWKNEISRNKAGMLAAIHETAENAIRILRDASPEDQGVFKDSWFAFEHSNGVDVINDAPHAVYVEEGTTPHWPPPHAIRGWIERNRDRLHGIPINPVTPEDIQKVTFLICRKIATEGTKPYHILSKRQGAFIYILRRNVEKYLST